MIYHYITTQKICTRRGEGNMVSTLVQGIIGVIGVTMVCRVMCVLAKSL